MIDEFTRYILTEAAGIRQTFDERFDGRRLADWHRAGLLPKPVRVSLGKAGTKSIYPAGSDSHFRAVCELRLGRRLKSYETIKWLLWWQGFDVGEAALRDLLVKAAKAWDNAQDRFVDRERGTLTSEAEDEIVALDERRIREVMSLIPGRPSGDHRIFVTDWMNLITGTASSKDAEEQTQRGVNRVLGGPESEMHLDAVTLRRMQAILRQSLTGVAEQVPYTDLSRRRDLIRVLLAPLGQFATVRAPKQAAQLLKLPWSMQAVLFLLSQQVLASIESIEADKLIQALEQEAGGAPIDTT